MSSSLRLIYLREKLAEAFSFSAQPAGVQPLRNASQAVQPCFDVFQGVGVGKADISLTVGAEIDAGRNRQLGLFQNIKSESVRVISILFTLARA